ncbi:syntaxin-binding protein 5-like [Cebidichthys violaceus]|uniref:syntaxin-binding protein 5-like n=1 Tax=Cebidichthys violaceus TaxID=271503 RepID=UPI0035CADF60
MKKFNIRKVLDGLKEVSSSTPSVQVGPQENHLIQETLQSDHFQLCKTVRHGFPYQPSSMAFDPVQKILAIGTQSGALRLYPFSCRCRCDRLPRLRGSSFSRSPGIDREAAAAAHYGVMKGRPPGLSLVPVRWQLRS